MSCQPFSEKYVENQQTYFRESNKLFRLMCSCCNCNHPQIFDIRWLEEFVKIDGVIHQRPPEAREISAFLNCLSPEIVFNPIKYEFKEEPFSAKFSFKHHKWGQVINHRMVIIDRYPKVDFNLPKYLPEKVEKTLNDLYSTSSPTLQVIQSRKVLETICRDKLPTIKKDKLNKMLHQLLESEAITESIKNWVHTLRILGNEAVHEDEEFTELQAQEIISLLTAIIDLIYTYPEKIEQLRKTK
ncbi:DUF4145 domain-containing protein [Pasteurella atlantica]|nr:DUF4145 domain-containing protein [Pasteurella atlantica]